MMYSFSDEPGMLRALNRLLSSCSVKGAISAGEMLQHTQQDNMSSDLALTVEKADLCEEAASCAHLPMTCIYCCYFRDHSVTLKKHPFLKHLATPDQVLQLQIILQSPQKYQNCYDSKFQTSRCFKLFTSPM